MKMLLVAFIKLYWRFWPEGWRRKCLYRETCSRYVYRVTRTQGFITGVQALADRFGKCRSGYTIHAEENQWRVRLADGSCIDASEAAPHVVQPYQEAARRFEKTLNISVESPANVRVAQDSVLQLQQQQQDRDESSDFLFSISPKHTAWKQQLSRNASRNSKRRTRTWKSGSKSSK